jgi:hypothetical protein
VGDGVDVEPEPLAGRQGQFDGDVALRPSSGVSGGTMASRTATR